MSRPSDWDLVLRTRAGDVAAFGHLVRRHYERICRVTTHLLRDRAEAEDVAQETFLRAYRAIERFDGRSAPGTWLYRIAVNLALNALRSRKSRRTTTEGDDARLDALAERTLAGGLTHTEPPGGPDAAALAAHDELYRALARGIDDLSETLRTTLVLVCVDGRSHEEASAILGAPVGTIAWRVHEARRKLRQSLAQRGLCPEET